MTLRRPILAIIAFAILLGFYLWDVDHVERSRLTVLQQQQVFYHDPAKVVELVFQNEHGTVRLKREPGKPWRIVEPRELGANDVTINAWLENLRGARRQAEFVPDDMDKYGLREARASVEIAVRGDDAPITRTTLEFGSQPAAFGPVHAHIIGESTVFTVSEWFFKQSLKQIGDLRDRRLTPEGSTNATKLEVATGRGTITAERPKPGSTDWTMASSGRPTPVDRVVIDRVMNVLSDGQFLEIADNPTSSVLQLGLEPPVLTVKADGATVIEVGMRIPNREQFIVRNGEGTIGVVGRSTVGEFFRPPGEWTTKRMVWTPIADIQEIEAGSGNARLHLMKTDKGWIIPEMPSVPVREDRIAEYLEALTTISAVSFARANVAAEDLADYGVLDESLRITVTDAAGSTQGVRFGRTDTTEGLTFAWREQDHTLWKLEFTAQGRLFKFRRDFEERRLIPLLADRTARVELEVSGSIMILEKKGTAWIGTFPEQSPAVIQPGKVEAFLQSFEELESNSEMALMGSKQPAAVFRLFETGATAPYAVVRLMARNRQTRAGIIEFDGRTLEVDSEQFDIFDESMAALVVAVREQAELNKQNQAPKK